MNWLNKIPKKNKNLAWRIIDAETVVVPLDNQPYNGESLNVFNTTATRVWEFIDGNNSIADIIKKITDEYEIEYKEAENQVKDFFCSLLQRKFIKF